MTLHNKLLLSLGALGLAACCLPANAASWGIRFGYNSGSYCTPRARTYVCYGSPRYPSCHRVVIHDRAPTRHVRRSCTTTYRSHRNYVTHHRVRRSCAAPRTTVYRSYSSPRVVRTQRIYRTRSCTPRYERAYRSYRTYHRAPRIHRAPTTSYRYYHGRPQVRVRVRCGG